MRSLHRPAGLLLMIFLSLSSHSQTSMTTLVATSLSDSLKKEAVMVVRQDQLEITILSPRKAKLHHQYVYTILNSQGDHYATIHTFYDKFHDLVSVTGILYDATGNQLKKIKKSDMQDDASGGPGILLSDTRVKYYPFVCRTYPYTVSYEEEVELNGLFILPEWQPQPARNVAVGNSSLVIRTPANYPLRYKAYRYPSEPAVTEEKGNKTYTWQIKDQRVLPEEPYELAWFHQGTRIRLVPAQFEWDGYKGQLYSWEDLGKFASGLYQGKDRLPEEAKKKVHQLVDGLTDDRQKIAVLYKFLQQNTHYVGIELGIGGWQPFDAAYVYNKGYGDCKALSNYMVALLKEAGIRAATVLIRAGNTPLTDTSFACAQFNHAIAVAFTNNDSVWLECTSPVQPSGYLGSFTSDKDALLLDPAGSHIVHTPVYGVRQNHFSRLVTGNISAEGELNAQLQYDYSGLEQDALRAAIHQLSKKDLTTQRQQSLGIPNGLIKNLNYALDSPTIPGTSIPATPGIPTIHETITLSADHFATTSGNRLILMPGYFFRRVNGLQDAPIRIHPFELTWSYEETDSMALRVPAGYSPEGAPFSATFSCPCGSYRIHSTFSDGIFTLVCRFQQNKGIYDAATWPRMVRFFNLVHREGNRQLVFIKQ